MSLCRSLLLLVAVLGLAVVVEPHEAKAATKPTYSGDVIYLDATAECKAGVYKSNCYFQSKDAAEKVVRQFSKLNIKNYLFPVIDTLGADYSLGGDDLSPFLTFYSALKNTGGGFFLQEVSPWDNAGKDCHAYLQNRRDKLLRLNRLVGNAFLGFSDDEPALSDLESLHAKMKDCIQSIPEFKNKLWLTNLYPILSSPAQLRAGEPKSYTLADFGGCRMTNISGIEATYADYAETIFSRMKPEIGSFDLYPFNSLSRGCHSAASDFLKSNLKVLMQEKAKHGFIAATYIQASESIYADLATADQIAMSRKTAKEYGVTTLLYFVSHSTEKNAELVIKGMLDENNEPTQIYFNHLEAMKQ